MTLSKIKFANKKAKREKLRQQKRDKARIEKGQTKIRNKRMRKMMIQGRKEHLAQRAREKNYIDELEAEL